MESLVSRKAERQTITVRKVDFELVRAVQYSGAAGVPGGLWMKHASVCYGIFVAVVFKLLVIVLNLSKIQPRKYLMMAHLHLILN